MAVELWNSRTRNAIAEFEGEGKAFAYIREMIERHGKRSVAGWALEINEDSPMIHGEELLQLVLGAAAQ